MHCTRADNKMEKGQVNKVLGGGEGLLMKRKEKNSDFQIERLKMTIFAGVLPSYPRLFVF